MGCSIASLPIPNIGEAFHVLPSGGVAADQLYNWRAASHHFWPALAVCLCGAVYIVLGFFPYMDNFGHIFGMFAGFLIATCFLRSALVRGGLRV